MAAKKQLRVREDRERKVSHKGQKSVKGIPDNPYNELKLRTTVSITPTALKRLDNLSRSRNISRSELIEQIGRKLIEIAEIVLR